MATGCAHVTDHEVDGALHAADGLCEGPREDLRIRRERVGVLSDLEVQGLQLRVLCSAELDQASGFVDAHSTYAEALLVLYEMVGGEQDEGCASIDDA